MSVLIKGMEMPESCPCELLGIGYDLYCSFACGIPARVKEYYECCQNGTRPSWCPLVPVPPHGRLIDSDALKNAVPKAEADIFENCRYCTCLDEEQIKEFINDAPTIIEAEEE